MTARRIAIAGAIALIASTTAILALDAAARAWGNPAAAVLVALAAVWLGQGIAPLIRHRRHR
ncbi:hypothetical protein [Micromonospora sp. KC213]|uniref:hypothetical protein n=1 Tax=Micromonospora sp. KC213 TaxID=2530378 RepID=UPI0010459507|nr:hypothetical protein [Micromonospora sp. KC213]TDC42071.1 hypothetical protein E1166_08920 [Micromonospora sp. KC213]